MIYRVKVNDQVFQVEIDDLEQRPIQATVDGVVVQVWPDEPGETPTITQQIPSGIDQNAVMKIYAPIPGVITAIAVQPGFDIKKNQEICTLEAMKMKNIIRAPRSGRISAINVTLGQSVKHRDLLAEYAN